MKVELPNTLTVSIKNHGEQTLDLSNMSAEWFAWAVANGVRQSCGDADAGKAGTDEGNKAIIDKFTRIAKGEIPAGGGGGGARLDPIERELRLIVSDLLHKAGMKRVDANKDAKNPRTAFKSYLGIALTAKYGEDAVTEAKIDEAYKANWPNIKAKAAERAEAAKAELTL